MNRYKRLIAPLLAICLGLAILPMTVMAATPQVAKVQFLAPNTGVIGEDIMLYAYATDATGAPVPGVEMVFYQNAAFMNTENLVELGRAKTDAKGEASLVFVPTSEGALSLTASPVNGAKNLKGTATIRVDPGPAQAESEKTGIKVPGVGMWLFAAVLGGVWCIFLWAVLTLRTIFNQGNKQNSTKSGQRYA